MTEEDRLIAGRYRLLERIGRGAMGVVWRAHDESLDRMVAVKELVPYGASGDFTGHGSSAGEDANRRVMREGRIAARLQHPNAVTVYNVVAEDGRPWLIMEYLSSRSLADILRTRGPLDPAEALRIGEQLAAALAAAHAAGIVHRDVKPGNVLIAEDGTAKLTDFGISRATGDGTITATGDIAGTPAFFAPEVARGEQATFASDIFSLGSTLYNTVEGAPPFGFGENQIALLYRVAGGNIDPPRRAGALTPILQRLLRADPAARPDIAATRDALAAAAAGRESTAVLDAASRAAPIPGPASASAPSRRPRKRAAAALAGAVVLVIAAALAVALTTGDGSGEPSQAAPDASSHPTVPPASSRAASTPPSTTQPTSTTASTTSTTTSAPDAAVPPGKAIRSYYALVPDELRAGYARLSESFKNSRTPSFEQYRQFWQQWADVRVSDVQSQGGNKVAATITYVSPDGGTQTERHVYTIVHTPEGWAIDGQRTA